MADLSTLTITVRATRLDTALLVEIEPEEPKGSTFTVPIPGEEWKARA
jgi:hypothetical protein